MLVLMALLNSAHAEKVAQVLVVEGQAYVLHNGEQEAAFASMEIEHDATLITEEDSQLYLLLNNNRVVAFSDELELPVSKISALASPAVHTSVKDQLTELMDPEDRERLSAMVSRAEGVGGWHSRMTAAVSVVRGRSEAAEEEFDLAKKSAPGALPPALPALLAAYQPTGTSAKCIHKWAKKALPKKTERIQIMVKLKEGSITAAFSSDGDPLPACLLDELIGAKVGSDAPAELLLR